jgi:4-hydroxymandelate oxidase
MDVKAMLVLNDVECAARAAVDPSIWAYVAGGAGSERTIDANTGAFGDIWLQPRALSNLTTAPDTQVDLMGKRLSMPVLLAPTSPQRLLHADAELATARAAVEAGTVAIVSTDSHYPFPEIAREAGRTCWFQLYAYRSRLDVEATIEMAQEAGASALVLTVDATHPAQRVSAKRAGFQTPTHVDFGTLRMLGVMAGAVPPAGRIPRLPLVWEDLSWIRRRTSRPLFVKGIVHPQDARRCIDVGADGVIVSNHGGRQLDYVVPSVIALERVAAEVRNDCIVLMDGGIRSGVDVVKALALGARSVCIGRPQLWGLALGGQAGVGTVLAILKREIEDVLLQLGLSKISEVGPDCIADLRWKAVDATVCQEGRRIRSELSSALSLEKAL